MCFADVCMEFAILVAKDVSGHDRRVAISENSPFSVVCSSIERLNSCKRGRGRGRIDGGGEVSISDRNVTRRHCKASQAYIKGRANMVFTYM